MTDYVVRVLFQVLGSYDKGHKAAMSPLVTHHLNTHPASYYDSLGGHLVTHHLKTPPMSCFDSSGSLFGPTTSSQPHYATPNESNDSLGVFTTLLHSTTPNESI